MPGGSCERDIQSQPSTIPTLGQHATGEVRYKSDDHVEDSINASRQRLANEESPKMAGLNSRQNSFGSQEVKLQMSKSGTCMEEIRVDLDGDEEEETLPRAMTPTSKEKRGLNDAKKNNYMYPRDRYVRKNPYATVESF